MAVVLTETWTGLDDDGWDATNWPVIRDVRGAGGAVSIQSNTGRMVLPAGDIGIGAFTEPDLHNFDLTVAFAPITTSDGGHANGVWSFPLIYYRVGANVTSGTPDQGYGLQLFPGRDLFTLFTIADLGTVLQVYGLPIDGPEPRWWRILVKEDRHRIKTWLVGNDEPPVWHMDVTDDTYSDGRCGLALYNNTVGESVAVAWDNLTIDEILPPPPGFHFGTDLDLIEALYVGEQPALAAYLGDEELAVP